MITFHIVKECARREEASLSMMGAFSQKRQWGEGLRAQGYKRRPDLE
jgi:hypothetical protein